MTDLKTSEPPVLAQLTDEQKAFYRKCKETVSSEMDAIEDALINAGLSQLHAASACAHMMIDAAARHATVTAFIDGRRPNREWFLHNCADALERWDGEQEEPG